jgi:hypothetical protein
MGSKTCIFNTSKNCNNCGECDICDLDPKKKCNNCGKCLELEGYDIKAINIDEIFENDGDIEEYTELDGIHRDAIAELGNDEEFWEYIDDIKELKDMNEEDNELSSLYEEFPGLLNFSKHKNDYNE